MKAVFIKDDKMNLWLFNVDDVKIRRVEGSGRVNLDYSNRKAFDLSIRDKVMNELKADEYPFIIHRAKLNKENVNMISKILMKNYEYLRESAGLSLTEEKKEDELKVDSIFMQLRPYSPYKLSEMLDPQFEPRDKTRSARESTVGKRKASHASTSFSIKNSAEQVRNYYMYQSVNEFSPNFFKARKDSAAANFKHSSYQSNLHGAFRNSNQMMRMKCMMNW